MITPSENLIVSHHRTRTTMATLPATPATECDLKTGSGPM
jgi:hypothetical protein